MRTSGRGLDPITCKDLLPRASFPNNKLSEQDLEELQDFSLHPVHLGRSRAGYSSEDVVEGGNPCAGPWAGCAQPSRAESSPIGAAQLQAGPRGLPALLLPRATEDDGGAYLSQVLSCDGKAPGPFPSLAAPEKYELSRGELWPGSKSGVGISQGEICIEEIKREEDCSWSLCSSVHD